MRPQAILLAPTDGGLALARSLHARGVQVSVLADGTWRWVARTRWADDYPMGQIPGDRAGWLARLARLAEGGTGVLVPGTDRLSEFLVRERDRIPPELRSFESPDSPHLRLMDKGTLYVLAEEAGVRTPWALSLPTAAELERVAATATYPCLLKPALSHHWRRTIGDRRAIVLRRPDDLRREARSALEQGLKLLVTEYVPGSDRDLEGVVTVRRADGSYALAYGLRKLRSYPPGFGSGAVHESADVPETMALAKALLDSAQFVGVSNIEAKRHAETGERVLIDVNARLPQCWGLADAIGTDASWRLYATLAGFSLTSQPPYRLGVRTIAPSLEPKAILTNLTAGRLTLRQLLASYRGVRDVSGLSLRDPGPIVTLVARQIYMAVRWAAKRLFTRD